MRTIFLRGMLGSVLLLVLSVWCQAQTINLAGVYEANTKGESGTKQLYAVLDFNTCKIPDFTQTFSSGGENTFKFLPSDYMKKITKVFKGTLAAGFVKYKDKYLFSLTEYLRLTNPRVENGVITVDWEDELARKGSCTVIVNEDKSIVFKGLGAFEGTTNPDGLVVSCVEDRSVSTPQNVSRDAEQKPFISSSVKMATPEERAAAENIAVAVPQVKAPFKGEWYSPELSIKLDLYGKSVPDIMAMDEDPCAGIIQVKEEMGNGYSSILSFRIDGGTVYAKVLGSENEEIDVILKYMEDGSLIFIPKSLTYWPMDRDGVSLFPAAFYKLAKKAPFVGRWQTKDGNSVMNIDLYEQMVYEDAGNESIKGHGYINLVMGAGMRVDNCTIEACRPDGNKAEIDYVSGRDDNTYRSTLIYDPATQQIVVKGCKLIKKGDFGIEDCYMGDGLIFRKQK